MNSIKWSTLGTFTQIINGDGVAPTLKNLAGGTYKIGDEIDNSNGDRYSQWELSIRGQTAFGAGAYVSIYFIHAVNGTNYEDGSDTVIPNRDPDMVFAIRPTADQQKIAVSNILLPPNKFKPLFVNNTGIALTNTDDENLLSYRTYTDEIQ